MVESKNYPFDSHLLCELVALTNVGEIYVCLIWSGHGTDIFAAEVIPSIL